MTKKLKSDEGSDSDDLQALFDSIASAPSKASVQSAPKPSANDTGGDDSELQALFDSVASEFEVSASNSDTAPDKAPSGPDDQGSAGAPSGSQAEVVFNRIGVMTRQVHDTLRALGADNTLHEAVKAMPDVRQRLNYITQMTEQAASRVLNATDIAKPIQDAVMADAAELERKWEKLYANELSVDEFKALAGETRGFIGRVSKSSKATSDQLLEIMMAQDFQDLTGQVIKKVVDLAQTLESELLGILLEVTPPEKRVPKVEGLMNGPVINAKDRDDVVTTQEQVDDLLDSLGF